MTQTLHSCLGGQCYGGGVNPHKCEVDSCHRGNTCPGCLPHPTDLEIYRQVMKQHDDYFSGNQDGEQKVFYRHEADLESQLIEVCKCEIKVLMSVGCKCGAL